MKRILCQLSSITAPFLNPVIFPRFFQLATPPPVPPSFSLSPPPRAHRQDQVKNISPIRLIKKKNIFCMYFDISPLRSKPCHHLGSKHDPKQQHNEPSATAGGDNDNDHGCFVPRVGQKQVARFVFLSVCLRVFPRCFLCLSVRSICSDFQRTGRTPLPNRRGFSRRAGRPPGRPWHRQQTQQGKYRETKGLI